MTHPDAIPAAWQRPPRPQRRVRCCSCLERVPVRSTWPLWGERICRPCLSVDDARIYAHENRR